MADESGTKTIVVAWYDDESGAKESLHDLKKGHKDRGLKIRDAAVLKRDEKGRIKVSETADWSGRKGATVGLIAGAAIGVVTGGVGWLALGGGAIGGLTSRLRDSGFDDDRLREVTKRLKVGTSMLVAVCDGESADGIVELLETRTSEVLQHELDALIAAEFGAADVEAVDVDKAQETMK